jgi:N-acetyl-D-muramate 6-phosphate phosphatase
MPLDIPRICAICFDVDGTLSNTDDVLVEKLERILRPIHYLLPHQDLHGTARRIVMWSEAPGNFLIGLPDTLGMDNNIAKVMELLNRRRARPRRDFLLIPGVMEMLQALSTRYPLAVVSARDKSTTQLFLDKFGLTPFFQVIVTGQTAEHTKPYPDPILYAAKGMHVSPKACLMVGDTTVDIRAGKAAGAQTVGVLCGFGEESELSLCGADLLLSTTADLADMIINSKGTASPSAKDKDLPL